jgi:hypothetical protein
MFLVLRRVERRAAAVIEPVHESISALPDEVVEMTIFPELAGSSGAGTVLSLKPKSVNRLLQKSPRICAGTGREDVSTKFLQRSRGPSDGKLAVM